MTPEEKAIVDWAIEWRRGAFVIADESYAWEMELASLVDALDPDPIWVETTMTNALINDRIRIGAEETLVRASTHGIWNVDTRDAWHPVKWQHIELRLDLEAVPELKQYPPAASIDILCTPERLAVLRIQEGFPGSAVTSSHVD